MHPLLASLPIVSALSLGLVLLAPPVTTRSQSVKAGIPYADVRPILDALREDLLPHDLRGRTPAALEALWPAWVPQRDAMIRARVERGDADSLIHLLLFGTTFTNAPRASERDLAALVASPAEGLRALRARIDDFAAGVAAPGGNERLEFARRLIERTGIDPATEAGRVQLRRYLDERTQAVGGSVQSSLVLDPAAGLADKLTVFRDRGLSADTSIFVDLGIERALDAMRAAGVLRMGSVRRVAIIGPGLDFTDKLDGYDFYPEQTVQPFAIIDSLLRLDIAETGQVQVTAFDLSPRVLRHLEAARVRARAGTPYSIVLPRNTDRPWAPDLVEYWQRFGNWIGEETTRVPPAPAGAGRVAVRGVFIRPPVVLSVTPLDLNIVTERLALSPPDEPFDLVIATNILLYYDVFEQSLAAANIAGMLRPGGFLLSNNRVFELPDSPLSGIGFTDTTYMSLPGIGDTGDRLIWYQKH
ncbi:MAG: class I SAM-dependent methyltransferase [Acidobacteria bacterium]|nr:class I SAM-dependent methyltransferase [Acidobacteriota bacterium]